MKGYIDSHTHITNEELDVKEYLKDIEEAKAQGLSKSLLVMTEREEEILYEAFKDDVYFDMARGIFPCVADKYTVQDLDDLTAFLKKPGIVALGEIGLDYHWAKEIKDQQIELFIKQIDIANALDLPIIIHSREAMGDTLEVLKRHECKRKGVIHCFSGSLEMMREFVKLGYMIAFGGTITYKNNVQGIRAIKELDLDHLLIETDAPYLTPVPKRGQRNKTSYVKYVYDFISELLAVDKEVLKAQVYDNYKRLFLRSR